MATTAEAVELALAEVKGAMGERFAGLEGKIDALTTAIHEMGNMRAEDVTRLERVDADQETRLREVINRKTVAPMTLYTVVSGAILVMVAIAALAVNALK